MGKILSQDEKIIKYMKWTIAIVALLEVICGIAGLVTGTHFYFIGLSVLCLGAFVLVLLHGVPMLGARNMVIIFLIGTFGSLLFEALGVNYGLFFSKYTYTGYIPGPKLFGFNVFSMVGYGMAVYELWFLAQAALGLFKFSDRFRDYVLASVVGGLLFVSIDLATDPLLATITGAYDWEQPGVYYGVPYQNYLGWYVMAIVIVFCISMVVYVSKKKNALPGMPSVAKKKWFWKPAPLLYGALFLQMPFYALIQENQEVTVYSGQSFMTHDIYWGVCIVYAAAILVPALIIWGRIDHAAELED